MTAKFDAFEAELRALCRKHGVILTTEMYDALEVWDATGRVGEDEIHSQGFVDHTKGAEG